MNLWNLSHTDRSPEIPRADNTLAPALFRLSKKCKNHMIDYVHLKLYWVITGLLFVIGLCMLAFYTPTETVFGPVQRIFYIHLPTAICMFAAASTLFVSSASYLWSRCDKWDDLAASSSKVTVLLCTIVLFTGMVWGKSEWGHWWSWTPRLTFSLVLWILYITYLAIRPMIKSPTRRATICAVYGLAAFVDVPLVYVSVKLMPDIHPSSFELESGMKLTLFVWSLALPLMVFGLITVGYTLNRQSRARLGPIDPETNQQPSMTNQSCKEMP